MKDIQNQLDHRRINIKKVGVKTISYPITLLDKKNNHQHTVASLNMYVNLPHKFKGTHMSRFIEILNLFHGKIELAEFQKILEEMKERLDAEASHIEISFPYFLNRKFRAESLKTSRYDCQMHGSLEDDEELEFRFNVPIFRPLKKQVHQGMPWSRGHWGNAVVAVRFQKFIWIEDLIMLVEKVIYDSSRQNDTVHGEIYSVESLTEKISEKLSTVKELKWYSVLVENLGEGYSTFALLESSKDSQNALMSLEKEISEI
ncbi:MAG: GTP cyclohydrolase, FolE2/MptA family [Desulfopila sp.]|jgi:GTP cyclohydrolase I|nr:GTP cyclohydrolase, FolE2/MptA family [Desulfopila sp.]